MMDEIEKDDDAAVPHRSQDSQSLGPSEAPQVSGQAVYRLTADELDRLLQSRPGPSRAVQSQPKHSFTKAGLARQHEFNLEVIEIIQPIAEIAPDHDGVKQELEKQWNC